jgi:hypothetical protein
MSITARADAACRIDHPLPRDVRAGRQSMERIADGSGGAGMAKPAGDLPIGGDLSQRDLRHQTIDRRIKIGDIRCPGGCRSHPHHPCHRSPEATSPGLLQLRHAQPWRSMRHHGPAENRISAISFQHYVALRVRKRCAARGPLNCRQPVWATTGGLARRSDQWAETFVGYPTGSSGPAGTVG